MCVIGFQNHIIGIIKKIKYRSRATGICIHIQPLLQNMITKVQ